MKAFDPLSFAQEKDREDPLKKFRSRFFFPETGHEKACIYFCGNSLGLQPKGVEERVKQELVDWQKLAVAGHSKAKSPWVSYERLFPDSLAKITGGYPNEVVAMNSLSANLHLMMVSFYRPDSKRYKILIEGGTFPSDQYAVDSQVRFHGFEPEDAVVALFPEKGSDTLTSEQIERTIQSHADTLALVMMSGVHYYSGQLFDMERISRAAHDAGSYVGFDLAHAAGNVPLRLHNWNVDFAVWCSYKYLNSGPGGVGGAFVHRSHHNQPEVPRFEGWWGHDEATRFQMPRQFKPQQGALAWQLSNAPVLSMAAHKASLDVFDEAGMDRIRRKSIELTGFLYDHIKSVLEENKVKARIITPANPDERGAQLSISFDEEGREVFDKLTERGVFADWREPSVIRIAPAPLYNTFEEAARFSLLLEEVLAELQS